MTTLKLHRYVLGGVSVFVAFGVTLPIAMMRVSQTDKFVGQPFNSLTCEGKTPDIRAVVEFQTCAQMNVEPVVNASPPQPATTAQLTTQPETRSPSLSTLSPSASAQQDPFAEAYRIADRAVAKGKNANTPAEWRNLAAQWQQAADLMGRVSREDSRYAIAQDRIVAYQRNRQAVLQRAKQAVP
jgi:hypothetical protein